MIDYSKAFDCINHERLRVAVKDTGMPQPSTFLTHNLRCEHRKLLSGQNRKRQNGFLLVKVSRVHFISLFNLYAEHIMRKTGLDSERN